MNAKFSQQVENKQIIYTLKQRPQTAKVPRCRVQSTAVHLSPQERLKSRLRAESQLGPSKTLRVHERRGRCERER